MYEADRSHQHVLGCYCHTSTLLLVVMMVRVSVMVVVWVQKVTEPHRRVLPSLLLRHVHVAAV